MTGLKWGLVLGGTAVSLAIVVGFVWLLTSVVAINTRPVPTAIPTATIPPTSSPVPTPVTCDASAFGLPPMALGGSQVIPVPGGKETLTCALTGGPATGSFVAEPTSTPTVEPRMDCPLDSGQVVGDGKSFEEGGLKYTCQDGAKELTVSAPPTATPTAASLAPTELPTATPLGFGDCALPSPDGVGDFGGMVNPGKSVPGSVYTCDANRTGQWIHN